MLEGLHVPFPQPTGLSAWPPYLTLLCSTLALIIFVKLSELPLLKLPIAARCGLVTLIYVTLHETFRVLIIDITLTNALAFHLVKVAPHLLATTIFCSTVVLAAPRLRSPGSITLAAAAISAIMMFALQPALNTAFKPALSALAAFDYPQIYNEPFKGHVLFIIYVTFMEAVAATFAVAALSWDRLSANHYWRFLQFVALVMFLKGSVFHTLIESFWIKGPLTTAVLSEGQFGLETLTMAVLVALFWPIVRPDYSRRRPSSGLVSHAP